MQCLEHLVETIVGVLFHLLLITSFDYVSFGNFRPFLILALQKEKKQKIIDLDNSHSSRSKCGGV